MCEDYNIKKKERVRRYFRYYIEHIIIAVRGFAFFFELDWEKIKKKDG